MRVVSGLNLIMRPFGLTVRKIKQPGRRRIETWPVEFDSETRDAISYVYDRQLTMVSPFRLFATAKAAIASCENGVAGEFVECGVWRGGNSILAAMIFRAKSVPKRVILFDTFAGMSRPTEHDVAQVDGTIATEKFEANQQDGYNSWAYASREEVLQNFEAAGIRESDFSLVEGPVEATLKHSGNLPASISTLRLDTDWYESTKVELERLYPLVSPGGQVLIDDYGSWAGSRKAVDEYFLAQEYAPPLHLSDYDGRVAMKMRA